MSNKMSIEMKKILIKILCEPIYLKIKFKYMIGERRRKGERGRGRGKEKEERKRGVFMQSLIHVR